MYKSLRLAILALLLFTAQAYSQLAGGLRSEIKKIVGTKSSTVGVAISSEDGRDTLSVYGNRHFPMQSVFKFHIAVCMLAKIDKGKFSLDQKINIKKNELLPGLWSPIREKYPEGAVLTIGEIIDYAVSVSDNVACDVLLRLLGGPQTVERYMLKKGFKDVSIKINEETMQGNWASQYQNWTTPKSAIRVLKAFYDNKDQLLSASSHHFIWNIMKATQTGKNQLKGLLPAGTVVAHKTGNSGVNKATGEMAALNDIGVVFLPNGKHYFISVFVTASRENLATNEKIMADISSLVWKYFSAAK